MHEKKKIPIALHQEKFWVPYVHENICRGMEVSRRKGSGVFDKAVKHHFGQREDA